MDRQAKAESIIAEVDALFHAAEKASRDGAVTYLDIQRIAGRVREHFDGNPPAEVEGGLEIAGGLCHPSRLRAIAAVKKGIGLIVSAGGSVALVWGILQIIAYGVVATTTTGALWWKVTTISILFGGPMGVAVGIMSLATGVWMMSRDVSQKERAVRARDVICKTLRSWAKMEGRIAVPNLKWLESLSEEEYAALLSLVWYLVNADGNVAAEELELIGAMVRVRRPQSDALARGMQTLGVEEATRILRGSAYAKACAELLRSIPQLDRRVDDAEVVAWEEVAERMSSDG